MRIQYWKDTLDSIYKASDFSAGFPLVYFAGVCVTYVVEVKNTFVHHWSLCNAKWNWNGRIA